MRQLVVLSLLVLILDSCRRNNDVDEPAKPGGRLEKIRHIFGRDGGVNHHYYYDGNGRVISMVYDDFTSAPMGGILVFRNFVRNSSGAIIQMTSLTTESRPDTLTSVITYEAGSNNIDHVVSVGNTKKDSSDYVYTGTTIHVDRYNWDTGTQQYTFLHRTSYSLQGGNVQSIKRVQPGSLLNTWTKTFTYDQMVFPIPMTAQELILANWFEGPLVNNFEGTLLNNKTSTIFEYNDGAGNPKTETEQYVHTYGSDKRPLKTTVSANGSSWGEAIYFYQ